MVDHNVGNDLDIVIMACLDELPQIRLTTVCTVEVVQVTGQITLTRTDGQTTGQTVVRRNSGNAWVNYPTDEASLAYCTRLDGEVHNCAPLLLICLSSGAATRLRKFVRKQH